MTTDFTIIDVPQRSQEWYDARAGRLTGSCAAAAIAFLKNGKGEKEERRRLRLRLVCERLTGHAEDEDTFITKELLRGAELEGLAAAAYEAAKTDAGLVRWSGFLSHNTRMVGCSLDGHIERAGRIVGVIEVKVPKSTTHLTYLLDGVVPEEYAPQATHNLWVSGADWCDFVSFDNRFPQEQLQLFVHRVTRDQVDLVTYEEQALTFLAEVDRDVAVLLHPTPLVEQLEAALEERTAAESATA